jgi:hypothetical protein
MTIKAEKFMKKLKIIKKVFDITPVKQKKQLKGFYKII